MRGRLCLIGVGLLMLSGCGEDAAESPPRLPAPPVVQLPASAAGGACQVLDFSVIEQATGIRFDVSAASQHRKTYTCVVRSEDAEHPELALSVTPTSADAAIFKDELVPRGGQTIKGLGKAAYQVTMAAGESSGAGAEVGWLTGDGRLVSLHYTFEVGQDRAAADDFAAKLVTLAKKIDTSSL